MPPAPATTTATMAIIDHTAGYSDGQHHDTEDLYETA
jgi:hypothetical protein